MASAGQPSLSKGAIRRYVADRPFIRKDFLFEWYLILFRKLVVIGDGACGKTSLLSVFTLGYFPRVCGF
jgi:hypothetical protein